MPEPLPSCISPHIGGASLQVRALDLAQTQVAQAQHQAEVTQPKPCDPCLHANRVPSPGGFAAICVDASPRTRSQVLAGTMV